MTKNSRLDGRLSNVLVDVVDNIRRRVHGVLGTRPWTVEIVTRRWSGPENGVGHPVDTVLTLDPTPMVRRNNADTMGPAGREPRGSIVVTELSLRYSFEELSPKVDRRTEIGWRVRDAHGFGIPDTWYVLMASPIPRMGDKPEDSNDWYVVLNATSAMTQRGGVNGP